MTEENNEIEIADKKINTQYLWSDAWFLLAVIYAGKEQPAALSDIIAVADFINHAIITFEETEGALARLTAGGFIIDAGTKISPTEKTMSFYKSSTKRRHPVLNELEDIGKLLQISDMSSSFKPQDANRGVSYPSLTHEQYNEAVRNYDSRLSKLQTRVKKKRKQ